MRRLLLAALICALVAMGVVAAPAVAQDAVKADADHHKVEFENDQVRIVRYSIKPGEKTAQHEHPKNVQVMLTDHNGKVTTPDGKTVEVHRKAGTVLWREAGTHIVENIGDKPLEGILIEPKNAGSAAALSEALDPVKVDAAHHKLEFENDQVRVLRYKSQGHEKTALHEHPNNVQVLLTDQNGKVTVDGKTSDVKGTAGAAAFRQATKHVFENTSDQPIEAINVEFK